MKIGVSNLKGGVGKTTVSQNLAVCFAQMGFKTCIIDTDENQNSLAWSGVRSADLPPITVVGIIDVKALAKTVDYLHKDYEVVIIDGTPSLSEMTTGIIIASDILIIPILASAHDYRAMQPFFSRYEQAKIYRGDIPAYFLINQFSANGNVYKRMKEAIQGFDIPVLETTLNKRAAYIETAIDGKGVIESSDIKAREEMIGLTKEILAIAEKNNLVKTAAA
jgi:chromosome partitioning protein